MNKLTEAFKNLETSDYVVWGGLALIIYLLYEQNLASGVNAPLPNFISPSTVCN